MNASFAGIKLPYYTWHCLWCGEKLPPMHYGGQEVSCLCGEGVYKANPELGWHLVAKGEASEELE